MIYWYIFFDEEGALTMNPIHLMQCKKTLKYKVNKTMKDKNQVVFFLSN